MLLRALKSFIYSDHWSLRFRLSLNDLVEDDDDTDESKRRKDEENRGGN